MKTPIRTVCAACRGLRYELRMIVAVAGLWIVTAALPLNHPLWNQVRSLAQAFADE